MYEVSYCGCVVQTHAHTKRQKDWEREREATEHVLQSGGLDERSSIKAFYSSVCNKSTLCRRQNAMDWRTNAQHIKWRQQRWYCLNYIVLDMTTFQPLILMALLLRLLLILQRLVDSVATTAPTAHSPRDTCMLTISTHSSHVYVYVSKCCSNEPIYFFITSI